MASLSGSGYVTFEVKCCISENLKHKKWNPIFTLNGSVSHKIGLEQSENLELEDILFWAENHISRERNEQY